MSQSTTTTTVVTPEVIEAAMAPMVKQCGITLGHVDEQKPTLKRKVEENRDEKPNKKTKKYTERDGLFRYAGECDCTSDHIVTFYDCELIAPVGSGGELPPYEFSNCFHTIPLTLVAPTNQGILNTNACSANCVHSNGSDDDESDDDE